MDDWDVYFEDLVVGEELWGSEEVADRDDMVAFAEKYDPWPMHIDEEAGEQTPFGGLIASGGYTIGLWYRSGHGYWNVPGNRMAFLGAFDWHVEFKKPLLPEDRVRLRIVFTEKRTSSHPGRGIAKLESDLLNQRDEVVLSIAAVGLVATRPDEAA